MKQKPEPIPYEFNEKIMHVKLKSDDDGHWYLIPSIFEREFDEYIHRFYNDLEFDEYEEFERKFSQYMTGGDYTLVPDYYTENNITPITIWK